MSDPIAFQQGSKAPMNTPLPKAEIIRPLLSKEENFHIVPEESSGITQIQVNMPPPGLSMPESATPEPEFKEADYPKLGNGTSNMNGWQKLESHSHEEISETTPVKLDSDVEST